MHISLSMALNFLVLALSLTVLWSIEVRGKQLNNTSIGILLSSIGLLLILVGIVFLNIEKTETLWNIFKNTGLSVFTSGIILLIRLIVQKKPKQLTVVVSGAAFVTLLAIGLLIREIIQSI